MLTNFIIEQSHHFEYVFLSKKFKRNQVIYLTIVVIISVALASGIVALLDLGLTKIINYVIYK